jgi:predicted ATP-dependent endonuclease of OLD family
VWFKKIQEDKTSKYILLLDEPGLSLHASAQADMLRFLEDLSADYQIIYTTHSPFAIPSENLDRVRTVLETEKGSVISDSIQEKDPKTLFPLQAALGYDIAQNLFISSRNLLVEGISDLVYLETLSGILESEGRNGLRKDITLVPTGGLDKVATFISLLRGNKLEIVCLLDTPTDPKGKARLEDMIKHKLISAKNIRFFNDFIPDYNQADIEDLFNKQDYLKLFNKAFEKEYKKLELSDLNDKIKPIIIQINKALNIERFNHYRPANQLLKQGLSANDFEKETLDNFEKVIKEINGLFK